MPARRWFREPSKRTRQYVVHISRARKKSGTVGPLSLRFYFGCCPLLFRTGMTGERGKARVSKASLFFRFIATALPEIRGEKQYNFVIRARRVETTRSWFLPSEFFSSLEFIVKYARFFLPWFVKTINCSRCLNVPCNPGASSLLLKRKECRKLR